jgi:hypothetical protein
MKKAKKNPAAQALGARGGKKSWANLTPKQRSKKASALAKARWKSKS